MAARARVADFWDDVLGRWLEVGAPASHLMGPLPAWKDSYTGTGNGAVDLSCYPDPYVGDLRGDTHDVRMVVLGLNPGVGYPSLQAHGGVWAERIRQAGYSRCFQRSPAEDPVAWQELHGKESPYWRNLIRFTRRWLHDEAADVHSILNFELYPWHSASVVGQMLPPADLIDEFVWAPTQEVDTPLVFAFGAAWFSICEALDLPEAASWGAGGDPFPGLDNNKGWRLAAYRLPSKQFAIISSQPGYSGPPGPKRLEILRELATNLLHEWEVPFAEAAHTTRGVKTPTQVDSDGGTPGSSPPILPVSRLQPPWNWSLLALQTVSELHQRGYQRLRIVPGISGSGFHWRCTLVPAGRLSGRAGFTVDEDLLMSARDEEALDAGHPRPWPPIVLWTTANEAAIFGVPDADLLSPSAIADVVIDRHPELMREAEGQDWAYAGWFLERLGDARKGIFPIAYDNWVYSADTSDCLHTAGPGAYTHPVERQLPPPTG